MIRQLLTESLNAGGCGSRCRERPWHRRHSALLMVNTANLRGSARMARLVTADWRVLLLPAVVHSLDHRPLGLIPAFQSSRADLGVTLRRLKLGVLEHALLLRCSRQRRNDSRAADNRRRRR